MSLFLREKSASIVLYLKGKPSATLSELSRKLGVSYPFVHNMIKMLAVKGFVEIKKEGKFTYVSLTQAGLELAKALQEVVEKEGIRLLSA